MYFLYKFDTFGWFTKCKDFLNVFVFLCIKTSIHVWSCHIGCYAVIFVVWPIVLLVLT